MRVYTFYNPIPGHGDPAPLIGLWRESWEKQGWKTEVLKESDAASHPHYQDFCEVCDQFPTVNTRPYEHACYVRWLAMAQIEDSLAVIADYDVINRSFKPEDADSLMGTGLLLLLEPTRVPCAVLGNRDGFQMLCAEITRYQPMGLDRVAGKPHVSDMVITRKSGIPTANVCNEFGCSGSDLPNDPGEGWKTAPLIHFSTYGFIRKKLPGLGRPKVERIREQLRLLNDERLQPVRGG